MRMSIEVIYQIKVEKLFSFVFNNNFRIELDFVQKKFSSMKLPVSITFLKHFSSHFCCWNAERKSCTEHPDHRAGGSIIVFVVWLSKGESMNPVHRTFFPFNESLKYRSDGYSFSQSWNIPSAWPNSCATVFLVSKNNIRNYGQDRMIILIMIYLRCVAFIMQYLPPLCLGRDEMAPVSMRPFCLYK